MSERYTPTTRDVRAMYSYGSKVASAAFDDWLAAHDAEVRKAVAEEIAAAIKGKYLGPDFGRSHDGRESPAAALYRSHDEGLEVAVCIALEIGSPS